jgi:hypothetical protein
MAVSHPENESAVSHHYKLHVMHSTAEIPVQQHDVASPVVHSSPQLASKLMAGILHGT